MNLRNRRLLVIDDNPAIHDDFKKVLGGGPKNDELDALEARLLGEALPEGPEPFEVDCAHQGQEGLAMVKAALAAGRPYALAVVDMRMPPGWNGLETIGHLWNVDPELQIVICTAYSDCSWADIASSLGPTDRLLVLKKPFEGIEVAQMASAMAERWASRRQAQGRLHELDALVGERNRALHETNERLRVEIGERKKLEAELRVAERLAALGTLAAGVAHEINNPLAATISNLDWVGEALPVHKEPPMPEIREAIDEARAGAQRVAGIVSHLNALSNIDHDRNAVGDAAQAVSMALVRAAPSFQGRARVVTELQPLPPVVGSPLRLQEVFAQILANASAAIAPGKPDANEIRVRGRLEGGEVVIEIADTGAGITPDVLPRIFDPFFTTRPVGVGKGLGLSICHAVITGLGGRIAVVSEPGKGSCFRVSLQPAAPMAISGELGAIAIA